MRWRSAPPKALAFRQYDDEMVVRNARTASTHLLDAVSAAIFRELLESDGATAEEIASRLADNDHPAWLRTIEEVLAEFQRLGLAETTPG